MSESLGWRWTRLRSEDSALTGWNSRQLLAILDLMQQLAGRQDFEGLGRSILGLKMGFNTVSESPRFFMWPITSPIVLISPFCHIFTDVNLSMDQTASI